MSLYCRLRNCRSGQDLDRFAILAFDDPIIGPDDNLQQFKNQVNLTGVVPTDPGKRFCVLLEPLADNVIGRAVIIDANWGSSTDVVYQFCRQSAFASVVVPSHGRFVGAFSQPFSEYKRKAGDRLGHNWRVPNVRGKRAVRHVVYDTNYWKSFLHARLAVTMGDRGCLSLFGDTPDLHRLFAEHVTSEYRVKTEGRGRTVDEWKLRPERGDNHWFDGIVGCAVAASMQGTTLPGTDGVAPAKRERVSFAKWQQRRQR